MTDGWPKILGRRTIRLSPWVGIVERDVEFTPGSAPQTYHALDQADYISVVALTPDRMIPLVRQYRPAVEGFTWELPAGLVDPNEDPLEACRREFLEETGLTARRIHPLGVGFPCTGRLNNRVHSFFVEAGDPIADFIPEAGLTTRLVSAEELAGLIVSGEFSAQLHLGALLLAELHSFLKLPR